MKIIFTHIYFYFNLGIRHEVDRAQARTICTAKLYTVIIDTERFVIALVVGPQDNRHFFANL